MKIKKTKKVIAICIYILGAALMFGLKSNARIVSKPPVPAHTQA